jgi:hypothetical protein
MDVRDLTDPDKLMYAWYLCQFSIYRQSVGWEVVDQIYRMVHGPVRYETN